MKKLIWKKKYLSDKSGSWYSAKVTTLGWEYVVESNTNNDNLYGCYLFENAFADEIQISKKKYKTLEAAQKFCQEHIERIINNVLKEFKK